MFSVKNKSNIRQVTPYGEFGAFEAKTFYPVSKIYTNAKAFFATKPQFEVWSDSLPVAKVEEQKPVQTEEKSKETVIPKSEEQKPAPETEGTTEEKSKQEETEKSGETSTDENKSAETPVVTTKPKGRRSL